MSETSTSAADGPDAAASPFRDRLAFDLDVDICVVGAGLAGLTVAREAARLGLDAGISWSCYDPAPGGLHCGTCDSCRLRKKGFEEAGLPDPTGYAV